MRLSRRQKILLRRAGRELDFGRVAVGKELLRPLVAAGNAEAIYINASVRVQNSEKHRHWHLEELKRAARLGYPPAIYTLGKYYDLGLELPKNTYRAALLFQKAAKLGHPRSMWIYAVDLLWGLGHFPEDVTLGLKYLEKARAAHFHEAFETTARFYEEGLFGYEKNSELAAHYRRLAEEYFA